MTKLSLSIGTSAEVKAYSVAKPSPNSLSKGDGIWMITMKSNVLIAMLLLVALVLVGQACNRAAYSADDPSKIRVGIVFDIGGKDDRSFNAAAWNGVKCAASGTLPDGKTSCGKPALNVIVRDVEPGNPVSIEPAMRAFAERNYDLVIGVGFAQGPIMQ